MKRLLRKRWLALLALLPLVASAIDPLPFADAAEEARFRALASELRCVLCQNQSLADSNAGIAQDLRKEVFELMRQGRSDEEIKHAEGLIAKGVAAKDVYAEIIKDGKAPPPPEKKTVEAPAPESPWKGNDKAKVVMEIFSDFQCPFCRDLDGKLRDMLPRLRDRVAVVRYDLPLERAHAHARGAAIASRCATRQHAGRRFDATLFEHDLDQPASDFVQLAGAADVPDLAAFRACMAEPAIGRAVDADVALAHRLGIEGVPALIVDGELYGGTMDTARLQALLSDAR